MIWIDLKAAITKNLHNRNLASPEIRINALKRISDLLKNHYPYLYNEPILILNTEKVDFKKELSRHKKLNSAESSIINSIYEALENYRNANTVNGCEKKIISGKRIKRRKYKKMPEIVDSANEMNNPLYGLQPVVNKETMLLILGTFPAKQSIDAGFYYQNQIKRFWVQALSIVGDFQNLSNKNRERLLLEKRIGLWDIFECVERGGSNQDKAIIKGKYNDLANFLYEYPSIKYLVFNGINAFEWLQDDHRKLFKEKDLEVKKLQSTSGSNARFNDGESWENYFNGLLLMQNRENQ